MITIFEADDLVLDITVTENGSAKDITGATALVALFSNGSTVVSGTATVYDAANGVVRVRLDEYSLTGGPWDLQVRVTIGTETQTVHSDRVAVRQSIAAA